MAGIPRVLSIAGSDSGGGAGIQADLKAFAACGVHGMTAITAITAQNTVGVSAVHQVPPEVIVEQVRQVAEDIGVDAVKIGMLGDVATIEAVVEALGLVGEAPVVLDPVMVAESGAPLLADDARDALRDKLLPLAAVTTPNLAEAEVLAGAAGSPEELARAIHALGPKAVVVTGGHRKDGGHRRLLRRRPARGDRGRASRERRRARLRLHALVRARRIPRARGRTAGCGEKGEGSRGARGQTGPRRHRPGCGAG